MSLESNNETESWSIHEKEVTEKPVAHEKVTVKPVASRNSEDSGNPKAGNRKWPHNFHVSSAVVPYMEKSAKHLFQATEKLIEDQRNQQPDHD